MLHFNSAANYSMYNHQMNLRKDLKTNTGETKEAEAEKAANNDKEDIKRKVTVDAGGYTSPDGRVVGWMITKTTDYTNKRDARNNGDLNEGDLVAINGKEYWYINGRFIRNRNK